MSIVRGIGSVRGSPNEGNGFMQEDLRLPSFTGPMSSLDAVACAARFVEREWGEHGYRIGVESTNVFRVRCSDGSEFRVVADRWGNTRAVPQDMPADKALASALGELTEASKF